MSRLSQLDGTLPDHPTDPQNVLTLLDTIGSPATVASAGGRYFGFVVGGSACPPGQRQTMILAVLEKNGG